MKIKLLLSSLAILVVASLATGCFETDNLFVKRTPVPVGPVQTNYIPVVVTNTVTQTNWVTNAVTGVVAPELQISHVVQTNLQPVILEPAYYTNLALTGAAETGVRTVGNVAGAAGIPFATTAAAGFLALTNCVFYFFNERNKKRAMAEAEGRKETESKLQTALLVGETMVENFEDLRKVAFTVPGYTREIDDKIMTLVQAAQAAAGPEVKSTIHDLVERNTGYTKSEIKAPANR